jgi:hypothetical protein
MPTGKPDRVRPAGIERPGMPATASASVLRMNVVKIST